MSIRTSHKPDHLLDQGLLVPPSVPEVLVPLWSPGLPGNQLSPWDPDMQTSQNTRIMQSFQMKA